MKNRRTLIDLLDRITKHSDSFQKLYIVEEHFLLFIQKNALSLQDVRFNKTLIRALFSTLKKDLIDLLHTPHKIENANNSALLYHYCSKRGWCWFLGHTGLQFLNLISGHYVTQNVRARTHKQTCHEPKLTNAWWTG